MGRTALVLVIAAVIGAGIFSGFVGWQGGAHSGWQPGNYQVMNGECWVHPQGDPLYDEHYAKNVNLPNCKAYELQEQAQNTEATTNQAEWQTTQSQIATWGFLAVAGFIILFIILVSLVK